MYSVIYLLILSISYIYYIFVNDTITRLTTYIRGGHADVMSLCCRLYSLTINVMITDVKLFMAGTYFCH